MSISFLVDRLPIKPRPHTWDQSQFASIKPLLCTTSCGYNACFSTQDQIEKKWTLIRSGTISTQVEGPFKTRHCIWWPSKCKFYRRCEIGSRQDGTILVAELQWLFNDRDVCDPCFLLHLLGWTHSEPVHISHDLLLTHASPPIFHRLASVVAPHKARDKKQPIW